MTGRGDNARTHILRATGVAGDGKKMRARRGQNGDEKKIEFGSGLGVRLNTADKQNEK